MHTKMAEKMRELENFKEYHDRIVRVRDKEDTFDLEQMYLRCWHLEKGLCG